MAHAGSSACGRALIVGGSIGGLFAALILRRSGWEAEVFERSTGQLAARGAGIVTHPALIHALEISGAMPAASVGVEIDERMIIDCAGAPIRHMRLRQIVTSWTYLYDILRSALPADCYRSGHSLTGFEQTALGVSASFSNGESASGDLLIAADGIGSTVRALLMPNLSPAYAGYIAWRGLVKESALSADTHRLLADRFTLNLPPHEEILGYPVAGPDNSLRAGERYYNFVWYRPADSRKLSALLIDREGVQHATSLPPGAVREETLEKMRRDADRCLAPCFAEVVRAAPHPFIQAIHELESPRLVFGRVVLIGDAAFLARPHVGMGVTKAAGDAVALGDALAADPDHLDDSLTRFERARLEYGTKIVERSRHLGQLILDADAPDSVADEIIRWTAATIDL